LLFGKVDEEVDVEACASRFEMSAAVFCDVGGPCLRWSAATTIA